MATELADLCRQLRLAHVVDYVTLQQNDQISNIVEQILSAELDGRRRAKLGSSFNRPDFHTLRPSRGIYMTISLFQTGIV